MSNVIPLRPSPAEQLARAVFQRLWPAAPAGGFGSNEWQHQTNTACEAAAACTEVMVRLLRGCMAEDGFVFPARVRKVISELEVFDG